MKIRIKKCGAFLARIVTVVCGIMTDEKYHAGKDDIWFYPMM